MAAFSSSSSSSSFQHHHTFLLDSDLQQQLPNYNSFPSNINNMCGGLFEEPKFSQFFQLSAASDHHHQDIDQMISTKVSDLGVINNDGSIFSVTTNKNSATMDSSSIVTDTVQFTQKKDIASMDKKRKSNEGSSPNSAQSKDMRIMKDKKQKRVKNGEETKKKSEEEKAPTGYIHVRARRGQATDSHSLAERVRREKISERMKLLQALVPGCEKVTGKALMLDEIINYVQSLQNQVEFLSMKLASVKPIFYDFGMDLESFMVRPDQDLHSLPSPLPSMQQCSPTVPANHHPLFMDNSANSLLFHHAHISNALPQGHRQVLWEAEDQRHKIMNQSGVSNSSLFSFH